VSPEGLPEPALPFRVKERRVEYQGRLGDLAVTAVEGPDGAVHERVVVHHPGAVGVLPLHSDNTVTLVYQYRAALDRGVWEIPAGLCDHEGEPAEETARRELVEEAGLAAEEIRHLATFHNSPGFSDEVVQVFLATGLREVDDDRQGIEEMHMEVARVPLEVARQMVHAGRITDAKTMIALLSLPVRTT
jgi:8-oxo-dGDP phosphatase